MYRKTTFNTTLIAVSLCLCIFVAVFITGCESMRFAPSEPQKQIAFQTHLTARQIEAEGTDAHSPAAKQVAAGTTAALAYTGMPSRINIEDYDTTLSQAQADSSKRPTSEQVFDAVDKGLNLAELIALTLSGTSGIGLGLAGAGKIARYIAEIRKRAKEFEQGFGEVVKAEQEFKNSLKQRGPATAITSDEALNLLRDHNKIQSHTTRTNVSLVKNG